MMVHVKKRVVKQARRHLLLAVPLEVSIAMLGRER
jgi:hypothetical protein